MDAKRVARAGVMVALLAVSAQVMMPIGPVPFTLQTMVLAMVPAALDPGTAVLSVASYVLLGALGLPVFAGGASTMALVGPSAGFLFGFLPGVVVIALLRGKSDTSSFAAAARTAGRYLLAALVGGVVVV